jgi:hypothetical protein
MKKLFYLIIGRWRILVDLCPWCNSDAPELYKCPVCKYNTIFPPPKELKEVWWTRYWAKIKLAALEKGTSKSREKAVIKESKAWIKPLSSSTPFTDQLLKEYIVPALRQYKKQYSYYPPTEIRFLKNIFRKPQVIQTDDWEILLERVGDEIRKLEEEDA